MITIEVASVHHIPVIQDLAERTWWPAYGPILSTEQIRYMLDEIYSANALKRLIDDGAQTLLVLSDGGIFQGFAAYSLKQANPPVFKLQKLYVLPENHGKGYGKALVDTIIERIIPQRAAALELNVNRFNAARSFYEKLGFRIIHEEDVAIGPYWMNDYVMRMDLLGGSRPNQTSNLSPR